MDDTISIECIPYARIRDIDFTKPKAITGKFKRGAHLHNDYQMLSDPHDIEIPFKDCLVTANSSVSLTSTRNLNEEPPTDQQMSNFFDKIAKHKPCCLSLISPFSSDYVPGGNKPFLVAPLSSLYTAENEELTYSELLHVAEVVHELNKEQIAAVEEATRG